MLIREVLVYLLHRSVTNPLFNHNLGSPGQPQTLGMNFSMWMLLERVRFTLDGLDCNKIGVGYEAFNGQPDFCSAPFWSCLHNQLWNFWDADQNRISRNQVPLFGIQGRFERINEHPNAGSHSFSIGITEVLNTNLLIELTADDVEYVYQRNPGKILSITVPTFEALTQFGTATITTKNIGQVEASYSLTFDCSVGVSQMEEQFYIMKPYKVATRSFKLYPTTDQAAKYVCAAILKDSDFSEVDRADCQFTTTATILDNGSQVPFQLPKTHINSFFESIEELWNKLWGVMADFITGKTCSKMKCSGFFDFHCHVQYMCMSWVVMFGLLLAIFPTVMVLIWLLHQKGFFDPLYDWWEDHMWNDERDIQHIRKHGFDAGLPTVHFKNHHKRETRHHKTGVHKRRKNIHHEHRHNHLEWGSEYNYYLHHVNRNKDKHRKVKVSNNMNQLYVNEGKDDIGGHRRCRKEREVAEAMRKFYRYCDDDSDEHHTHRHVVSEDRHHRQLHAKRKV